MRTLSRVLLMLGKVPHTAWEKRVLLMKAQTSPALQEKGVRVSTWGPQSRCSPPGPSKSTCTNSRLQGPEHTAEPHFQSIPVSALHTVKGPERRDTGNWGMGEHGAWCAHISLQQSCREGSVPASVQPPGASSPPLLLPLLCPAVLGSAPLNNGSFLAQPPSAGVSTLPRVPSGTSQPAHSQEESRDQQDTGPEHPAPAAHPPALLLVHAAPTVPAAAAAAKAASHQGHEDDEEEPDGHADQETQFVEQQLGEEE